MALDEDAQEAWERDAEALAGHVQRLLSERDLLARALAATSQDLDRAYERIDQLQALNTALVIELRRARDDRPRKRWVGQLTGMLLGIVSTIGVGFLEDVGADLRHDVAGVRARAAAVGEACEVDINLYVSQKAVMHAELGELRSGPGRAASAGPPPGTVTAVASVPSPNPRRLTTEDGQPLVTEDGEDVLDGDGVPIDTDPNEQ